MATTVFVSLIFKKYYRYAFLLFLFPLIFAYSRIYLGMHFPAILIVYRRMKHFTVTALPCLTVTAVVKIERIQVNVPERAIIGG